MTRFAYLVPIVLAACTDSVGPPPIDFAFCAEQHDEGSVVVCDQAFATPPRVHLPPDDATTVYAAVGGNGLVTRAGQVVDSVRFHASGDTADTPAGFAMPSYEFLERVYAISDQSVRPVLQITPAVIDGNLLGTWEGTMSRRISASQYNEAVRVPIRVTFDRFAHVGRRSSGNDKKQNRTASGSQEQRHVIRDQRRVLLSRRAPRSKCLRSRRAPRVVLREPCSRARRGEPVAELRRSNRSRSGHRSRGPSVSFGPSTIESRRYV